jgi:hypothetical protein
LGETDSSTTSGHDKLIGKDTVAKIFKIYHRSDSHNDVCIDINDPEADRLEADVEQQGNQGTEEL